MVTLDQCLYPRLSAHWEHNSPHLCTHVRMHSQNLQWTWRSRILSSEAETGLFDLQKCEATLTPHFSFSVCLHLNKEKSKNSDFAASFESLDTVVQIPRSISQTAVTAPLVFLEIYLNIILTIAINPFSLLPLCCKQQNGSSQTAMWHPACAAWGHVLWAAELAPDWCGKLSCEGSDKKVIAPVRMLWMLRKKFSLGEFCEVFGNSWSQYSICHFKVSTNAVHND